jgi:hypothetical protein
LEPFDRAIPYDVGFNDFPNIGECDVAVPYGVWINDDGGAMLALVEAAGLVGANRASDSRLIQQPLELALKVTSRGRIATAAGMSAGALVAADKDMLFEFRHGKIWITVVFHHTEKRAACCGPSME